MTSGFHTGAKPRPGASPPPDQVRRPTVIIRATRGWAPLNLQELWRYRDLVPILAGRDIKLRYRQTILGVAWVVLQPLASALIFAVIFGRFGRLPSDGIPYALFVFAGLVPWNLFAGVLQRAGNSLISDSRLISKVYFPRLLIPLSSAVAVLLDFAVALVVYAVLQAASGIGFSWRWLVLPLFLALTLVTAIGVSLWLSALTVQYRDFVHALPFVIQVWLYASPVVYATTMVPARWRAWFSLNPIVGLVEGFRWCLFGRSALTAEMLVATLALSALAMISGLLVFRRVERGFADAL